MLQRCRGLERGHRRGREGERIPIVKQIQSIVLQLCLLSKLCVIHFAVRAPPLFPTCHLLKLCCHCLSRFLSLLPRVGRSCCPCERLAVASACDWVLPPPPLPLFLSGPLRLLFFLAWGAPSAVAFLTLPLHLLSCAGGDISRKLVPSVFSP